jgi:hypothetical protein
VRSIDGWRALRAAVACLVAAGALAGCGKPIVVRTIADAGGDPIGEARVYRHRFGWFNLFPGKKFVVTAADGAAEVEVGSANTNLTILRSGFEPMIFGVFETSVPAIAADAGGYDHVVMFRDIRPRPDNGYEVRMKAVRREPMSLEVTDSRTGAPIEGAEVFGATFLYLPQPGVEADWGFPALQKAATDEDGRARVDQVSGFRNRVTVRLKGYQDATVEFDGRRISGPRTVDVPLRQLEFKQVTFLAIDAKSKKPVPGAEVRLGEARDGLPENPNGWKVSAGADGKVGPVAVPDMQPFVLSVTAPGYKEWRGAPVWRALSDGQVKRIEMRRK